MDKLQKEVGILGKMWQIVTRKYELEIVFFKKYDIF